MSLSGNQLNTAFAQGNLVGKTFAAVGLNVPSDLTWANGVNDSVSEQFHQVDINADGVGNLSVTAAPAGGGYWVPYLGSGANNAPVGVAVTVLHGLGTYSNNIVAGGPITWAATGPFTGCASMTVRNPVNDTIFAAHLITAPPNYTADTIANQAANSTAQSGMVGALNQALHVVTPPVGMQANAGWVFWMWEIPANGNARWVRRVVWTLNGTIVQIDNATPI